MHTKLSRFMDGLMEAVWLAALIVVPVFFNIYSTRIFEPDKIALLRSLTLVGLGAWVIKTIAHGRVDWGRLGGANTRGRLRSLLKTPLIPAVLGLAGVYLIATLLSVAPRVSLLGSYQRLQGAYTTFSYVVLFAMVAANLRRRRQVERLITTAVLASLPVGLYGILQRYEIDPLPWGGDTTRRVAANLGNSIFVAAYLITVFPLALGRIVEAFSRILDETRIDLGPPIVRGTVYVFTAAIQLIGIYFSLSRGPVLGLLAGTFFMLVLLSLYWGKRWLTLATIGAAASLGVFLVLFSLPSGPFENLRSAGTIGRLGNVFQTESGTGRVRVLIWQGAAELVAFHEPLEFPDGHKDPWNALRPFIGYGPESMFLAYNSVYPPELASIESRNASPDRSHNETWDALVITGMLGLAAEQILFVSVFFYGLKWLGLLNDARQRRLFLSLILAGGFASALGFVYFFDVGFLGVGLPFGMLLGLLAYLALTALFFAYERPATDGERARALTLMMVLGAVIAHYVEIHFGIAIAATRLYFWVYSGLLVAVGYWMTLGGSYGTKAQAALAARLDPGFPAEPEQKQTPGIATRKSRRKGAPPAWSRPALTGGLTSGILLAALSFNYITNSTRVTSIGAIIRRSLTVLPEGTGEIASYGILALFITVWLAWSLVWASEFAGEGQGDRRRVFLATAGVSLAVWFISSTLHAGRLAGVIRAAVGTTTGTGSLDTVLRQSAVLEGMLTQFYLILLALVILIALQLAAGQDQGRRASIVSGSGAAAAVLVGLAVLAGAWQLNLRVIHADIAFKVADPFTRAGTVDGWQVGLSLYQRSNRLAPQEDHYFLFLGKAYLELAQRLRNDSPAAVLELLTQAEADLMRAQRINPLNTDHTANLARLYRFWSGIANVAGDPQSLLLRSADYYTRALVLSPNNAVIRNEFALLYLQELGDSETGLMLLMESLEIDPFYAGTYGILGDYHAAHARAGSDGSDRVESARTAAAYYSGAIDRSRRPGLRYLYASAMGAIFEFAEDLPEAIEAYRIALGDADASQVWLAADALARLHIRTGDLATALEYAALSLQNAPEGQREAQAQLVETIEGLQTAP
ncbi:MAG TPA: hypothetical protein VMN57_05620 [Anaerolineales bacterium]|nr:hypothetical protein [Anaerolineales bacterium]